MNIKNTGTQSSTDSFTPRKLSKVSSAVPASAKGNFHGNQTGGSTENRASAPLAMEIAMVST